MSLAEVHPLPPSPLGNNQAGSPWKIPALAARCRELWAAGESAATISRKLYAEFHDEMSRELSRNAILGYAHREGFTLRQVITSVPKKKSPLTVRKRKHTPRAFMPDFRSKREREPLTQAEREANADKRRSKFEIIEIVDLPPEESAVAVSFLGLTDKTCRHPLGDPRDFASMKFCGDVPFSVGDRKYPYCLRHCRMNYQKAS